MAVVDLRYAHALDEVVLEHNLRREDVAGQLQDFQTTFSESFALREILENPSVPEEQKLRVLDGLAGRLHMSRTVRNFVAVIMGHGRLHELGGMIAAYLERADVDGGVVEAEVTSAHPLEHDGRRSLEESIAKLTGGSSVRATYRQDPALLGGAVIRVGSTVYDGSVRGQLEQMRQRMVAATF